MFDIPLSEFNYHLPSDKIAYYPLAQRDTSKMLKYSTKDKQIIDDTFEHIATYIPAHSTFFFNETKVFHARLVFEKPTGGRIEVFCLEPITPTDKTQWKCFIGNAKKWKEGELTKVVHLEGIPYTITAKKGNIQTDGTYPVSFSWNPPSLDFFELIETLGQIPLPPYIQREIQLEDKERYQTVYANHLGSVAAPTAGLHFSPEVMHSLINKEIGINYLTLHVGAGTFKPMNTPSVAQHEMHSEKIQVSKEHIQALLSALEENKPIIAVGTTSTRTLESLYWHGVALYHQETDEKEMNIQQWFPYQIETRYPSVSALVSIQTILSFMTKNHLTVLSGQTTLMIVPGYTFRIINGLVTNFHQPNSTLLLLVAAFVGPEWQKIYTHALAHEYRFLSYGDSCLFLH